MNLNKLRSAGEVMQPELKVRKILGRTYLNENKLSEALDIFIKILMDYPDDLETLLILGGFYLASGDGKTAKSIFRRAQQLNPEDRTIERQIVMAEEMENEGFEEPVPTDVEAVARLLQRLTGKTQTIQEDDIMRAALLLDKIVTSDSPADLVAAHLDEIDDLLQALIEVNIRQARADGRADVANALRSLQLNIDCQLVNKGSHQSLQQNVPFRGNLLMLLAGGYEKSHRMTLLKSTLESFGCQVMEKGQYIPGLDLQPDLVITSNPHTDPTLIESLSALSAAGIPIILDLDTNFRDQPASHPAYGTSGLNTQTRSNDYASAISIADLISVPSQAQALLLKDTSARVALMPDGWSRQNKLWEKATAPHNMINLGWVSSSGELDDLMSIRRFIIRTIREFLNTRIVIVGSPQAYRLFDGLPENRRLYIPMVADEELPHVLSQIDILLVPLRNQPYNHSLPDTILMQAGARGIPWIASPIPSFQDWKHGGFLTESVDDEWHLNLRHLVVDSELRNKLGRAGREAARAREMEHIGKLWLEAISQLTSVKALPERKMQEVI